MIVSPEILRSNVDYNAWANLRLLDAAAKLAPKDLTHDFQTADRSILQTLVHIFGADRVWLARLTGAPSDIFLTDADRSLEALQNNWPPLLEGWKLFAASLTDEQPESEIEYRDLKGRPWKQPLWQLMLHVVNHGTHHRGQVAGFLRTLGHTPPPLDMTFYYRREWVVEVL